MNLLVLYIAAVGTIVKAMAGAVREIEEEKTKK
jgi:hypothetical protein